MTEEIGQAKKRHRHQAFGRMKGTMSVAPGIDLTERTGPDWDAYAEGKYGPDSRLGKLWAQVVEREIRRTDREKSSETETSPLPASQYRTRPWNL